jgi:hypothetical protein
MYKNRIPCLSPKSIAVNFVENDSVYIHGKKLMVTGKEGNIIRAYNVCGFINRHERKM